MKHPYIDRPDNQFWKNEPGVRDYTALDPVSPPPFTIERLDKIVTAGSCFAQHVAKFMAKSGFNHYISEEAHPIIDPEIACAHNYGMFSARYGNIYTARQLKQLILRAYGKFVPLQNSWPSQDGKNVVDPFRPQIQPDGYLSEAELNCDRDHHFSCLRKSIEKMDVFVFTLGLTEAWTDRRDGAIFPIAPGVAGGVYDSETTAFVNFNETETFDDLKQAIELMRSRNPNFRTILTVSPVPLNATYVSRHVLLSTTWSKSVLRIAAENARQNIENCTYFPSYEIITSPHTRGKYYGEDCREVNQEGVDHVMNLFIKNFARNGDTQTEIVETKIESDVGKHMREIETAFDLFCDEDAIDNRD